MTILAGFVSRGRGFVSSGRFFEAACFNDVRGSAGRMVLSLGNENVC